MNERMLDKANKPTPEEMADYCADTKELYIKLNKRLDEEFGTEQKTVFPYGNGYGWGISHKKKNKLICNVFPENNSFTVMMRLSAKQCDTVYAKVNSHSKELLDNKYPCSDGGWIHYRISSVDDYNEILIILNEKLS